MFNVREFIDNNVSKFVFSKKNDVVVESVLYKYGSYGERTVICCSTQCGCPVACTFCGTGNNFIRNLTVDEILYQIDYVIKSFKRNWNYSKNKKISNNVYVNGGANV